MQAFVFIALGAISAAAAVALSAAVAHLGGLDPAARNLLASGLEMHRFHALGLILVGLATHVRPMSRGLALSGGLMVLGLLLFCANLYARALMDFQALRGLVPWGGAAFIGSWLVLGVALLWPARGGLDGAARTPVSGPPREG